MLERVVSIMDGRTFETAGRDLPVRLADVETPLRGRPGYGYAKLKLGRLIYGKDVDVEPVDKDRYGRTLAKVKLDGISVNSTMRDRD